MKNLVDFYILGEPIHTEIGKCDFIRTKDMPSLTEELSIISLSKLHIIQKYRSLNKDKSLDAFILELESLSLYEIITGIPEIRQAYLNVFSHVFSDDIEKINKNNFEQCRNLVLKMNLIYEEEINPNPEIQATIERAKRLKNQENDGLAFSDIVTSIVVGTGLTYEQVKEFTLYQLYSTFYRLAKFKNYETSTLFATTAGDKVKIESWSQKLDLYHKDTHSISRDEFNKSTGEIFDQD